MKNDYCECFAFAQAGIQKRKIHMSASINVSLYDISTLASVAW